MGSGDDLPASRANNAESQKRLDTWTDIWSVAPDGRRRARGDRSVARYPAHRLARRGGESCVPGSDRVRVAGLGTTPATAAHPSSGVLDRSGHGVDRMGIV